jgi:hypothetical protein
MSGCDGSVHEQSNFSYCVCEISQLHSASESRPQVVKENGAGHDDVAQSVWRRISRDGQGQTRNLLRCGHSVADVSADPMLSRDDCHSELFEVFGAWPDRSFPSFPGDPQPLLIYLTFPTPNLPTSSLLVDNTHPQLHQQPNSNNESQQASQGAG